MSQKASILDAASGELAKAFARLEKSISTYKSADNDNAVSSDAQAQEIERLRQENAQLSNQLQQLQSDYIELQQMNEQIASQIDQQIEQLELIAQ